MRYTLEEIPSGEAGTDATLRKMGDLIDGDLRRPNIRQHALKIIPHQVSRNDHARARSLYNWIVRNIRFVNDPAGIETVQSPEMTIYNRAGDCDDHAALYAGLARSIGLRVRFRVVGSDRNSFSHIYPEVFVKGAWLPADTTLPSVGFGRSPGKQPVEKIYSSEGAAMNLSGPTRVRRGHVKQAIRSEVLKVLRSNWHAGLINRGDVQGYLRVIDEGNFPTKEPTLVDPAKAAIREFLAYVDSNRLVSTKAGLSGLEGLDGFLSSVWGGVKKAVGGVIKTVTGGGETRVVVEQQPAPVVQQRSGFGDILQNPMVLLGVGALVLFMVKK